MDGTAPSIEPGEERRMAFCVRAALNGALIPHGQIGTYLLLHGEKPLYVGRSDHCVLRRLRNHEWVPQATHIVWEPCSNARKAFHQEAALYHVLAVKGNLRNRIHPARPDGLHEQCPFCTEGDNLALQTALRRNVDRNAVSDGVTAPNP